MSRIYLITDQDNKARLVRANHPAQAMAYVARSNYAIEIAKQDDLVEQLSNGVAVESAVESKDEE